MKTALILSMMFLGACGGKDEVVVKPIAFSGHYTGSLTRLGTSTCMGGVCPPTLGCDFIATASALDTYTVVPASGRVLDGKRVGDTLQYTALVSLTQDDCDVDMEMQVAIEGPESGSKTAVSEKAMVRCSGDGDPYTCTCHYSGNLKKD
jgi:hypothetical protein